MSRDHANTQMYTSYYNHPIIAEKLKKGATFIQVSRTCPPHFVGRTEKIVELAPPRWLLDNYKEGFFTNSQFEVIYNNVCLFPNFEVIINTLDTLLMNRDIEPILLCYESMPNFCHRHLISKFLKRRGVQIVELGHECQGTLDRW